jgi:HD superfamily phosphohydrolase
VSQSFRRTYHDPLHGAITLDSADPSEALLIQLIDTPVFQRLRRIRQLGTASLTFHGAEASRFTHSLGVMQVARRVFDHLVRYYPELQPHRTVFLCAALLHDLGHGPLSHTCEDIFQSNHEHWTSRILQEDPVMAEFLAKTDPQLVRSLQSVYTKHYPVPIIHQLISGQLDCDRLDYLLRDSYCTGASYGTLDLDRIILALRYDPKTQHLFIDQKGLAAIEHYLVVRYFMYIQVYNHPKNIASSWGLAQVIRRAKETVATRQLYTDRAMLAWLTQSNDILSLPDYLGADDGWLLYHLSQWQLGGDHLLADLSRRYLQRDLLKAEDISSYAAEARAELLLKSQLLIQQQDLDPTYYTGIQVSTTRGYTVYQRGIEVRFPQQILDISDVSPLVHSLIPPTQRAMLIYPKEIEANLFPPQRPPKS